MSIRMERVAALVQREIAKLLQTEFAEQVQSIVTVTHVRMTKDLSTAYVHVSVLGDTEAQRRAAFHHVEALKPELRAALASQIRHQLRIVPELRLFLDESAQHAQHMENLFDRIREERNRRDGGETEVEESSDA